MIGITNNDSTFFELDSDDINLDDTLMSQHLISLDITEQRDSMTQGSLNIYDPKDIFSRILRTGVSLKINWGYRDNLIKNEIITNKFNVDEINGDMIRRGLKGIISSPSGNADSKGIKIYNCNFTAYSFRGLDESKVYSSGTKKNVIDDVFDRIGVSKIKRFINFRVANDKLNTERSIRQDETDFLFLTRLAREWGALFSMGFSQKGEIVAIFADYEKIGNNPLPQWLSNATGSSHAIGYQGEINNVISYSWKSNESESGVGSNAQLDFVDGQVVIRRFVAEQETIVSYKLRPDLIKDVIESGDNNIVSQTKIVKDLLSVKDFDQIKHFFDPYESTTAPQGFGYKITAQMIGNPLFIPPNQVILNNGFPDRLGNKQTKYYLDKVQHKINKSGYKMSVDIVDAFSVSDIGVGLL